MTIECYYGACPHHGTNETPPDEGPFCYQLKCLATEEQVVSYQKARDASVPKPPSGYTAEELELDNPYNQWMNER